MSIYRLDIPTSRPLEWYSATMDRNFGVIYTIHKPNIVSVLTFTPSVWHSAPEKDGETQEAQFSRFRLSKIEQTTRFMFQPLKKLKMRDVASIEPSQFLSCCRHDHHRKKMALGVSFGRRNSRWCRPSPELSTWWRYNNAYGHNYYYGCLINGCQLGGFRHRESHS